MKTLSVLLLTAILAVSLNPQIATARDAKQQPHPLQIQDAPQNTSSLAAPYLTQRLRRSAGLDTTILGSFTFDAGANCVGEGWTSHDITAQPTDYWHVDDFAGLGGGSYGGLVALEGVQSLWCGTKPGTDELTCAYTTPGYGNNWNQSFCTKECLTVTGAVVVDYLVAWDSEPGYDYTHLEYDVCDDDWRAVEPAVSYDGTGAAFESHALTDTLHSGAIRIRFRFVSDPAWSDHDGYWNTDGAVILDSLTVSDGTGVVVATELFEDEAIDANESNDWESCNPPGYGDFSVLYPGITQLQLDPCQSELSCLWGFTNGSVYNYDCGGYPTQTAVPFENSRGQYIHNEIWSPVMPWVGTGTSAELAFDVYRDVPIENLVFYIWKVATVTNDCPGAWYYNFTVYYNSTPTWGQFVTEIGDNIAPNATGIRVALGAVDHCDIWCGQFGSGSCHSNAPLFDNIEVYRIGTTGPIVSPGWNQFHDGFATDGTLTGTVRADGGQDIYGYTDPNVEFGDEMGVSIVDPVDGLAIDPHTNFGPAAYLYVSVHPQNQPGKGGSALSDDDFRWPVVDSLVHDGDMWYMVRVDTFWFDAETRVDTWPNSFDVDLNDNLFTPGDTVFYFLSAQSDVPSSVTNYWSEHVGQTSSFAEAADNPSEFTCLPAGGYLRGGDILYVDIWSGYTALFDQAFESLQIKDKVDRYDIRIPSTGNPNSLSGKVVDVFGQILPCYRKIIWHSGGLTLGTLGDGQNRKVDDYGLLFTFLDQLPQTGGVYLSGTNLVEEWQGSTGANAIILRSAYMNFDYVSGDHVSQGLGFSPLVIGETGSIFDHTLGPDTMVAFGGCPGPVADFDVIGPTGASQLAASYTGGGPSQGAILSQRMTNAVGTSVGVVLSGFRYTAIADDRPAGVLDRAEHLRDILEWLGGVLDAPVGAGPDGYANTLSQNRPNPFNPVTTIEFSVRKKGPVSLKVYNVAGQLVRTLVDDAREPGVVHKIEWKGRNNAGQSVSSGVYFYKLVASDFTQTRKMVLLK